MVNHILNDVYANEMIRGVYGFDSVALQVRLFFTVVLR